MKKKKKTNLIIFFILLFLELCLYKIWEQSLHGSKILHSKICIALEFCRAMSALLHNCGEQSMKDL